MTGFAVLSYVAIPTSRTDGLGDFARNLVIDAQCS